MGEFLTYPYKFKPPYFLNRIAIEPSAGIGMVIPIAKVGKVVSGSVYLVLKRKGFVLAYAPRRRGVRRRGNNRSWQLLAVGSFDHSGL